MNSKSRFVKPRKTHGISLERCLDDVHRDSVNKFWQKLKSPRGEGSKHIRNIKDARGSTITEGHTWRDRVLRRVIFNWSGRYSCCVLSHRKQRSVQSRMHRWRESSRCHSKNKSRQRKGWHRSWNDCIWGSRACQGAPAALPNNLGQEKKIQMIGNVVYLSLFTRKTDSPNVKINSLYACSWLSTKFTPAHLKCDLGYLWKTK